MNIFLISCVKTKQNTPHKAKDMYISALFKGAYAYAKKNNADKIFILSAKYGLLDENAVIEPYDETLNKKPIAEVRAWASKVINKLSLVTNLEHDELTILASERYRRFLLPHLVRHSIPLKGLMFGEQLRFYKEKLL